MAITWSTIAGAAGDYDVLAWGAGTFVAIKHASNDTLTSPDGNTWTAGSLGATARNWTDCVYTAGIGFVAIDAGMGYSRISTDGFTWTEHALTGLSGTLSSSVGMCFGEGLFVMAGGYGTSANANVCMSSPDGYTWTSHALPAADYWIHSAYGGGMFVMIAAGGASPSSNAASSPDGITWTGRTLPAARRWNMVAYGNGMFVAVAYGTDKCASSPDGITWTERTMPSSDDWYSIYFDGERFVVFADYTTGAVATSTDGITWVADTSYSDPDNGFYGGAVSDSGVFRVTTDSTTGTGTFIGYSVATPINEGLSFGGSFAGSPVSRASANLALAQTITTSEVNALRESLVLAGAPTATAHYLATLSESLGMTTQVRLVLQGQINETLSLVTAATVEKWALVTLVDSLRLSGGATGTLAAIAQISEALALLTTARSVADSTIGDSLALSQTLLAQVSALEELIVEAVFNDTAVGMGHVVIQIDEGIAFDTELQGSAALIAAINEGLRFAVSFTFDDTPILGLSLNAATKAVTSYTSYPFNSMVAFNRSYFGAGEGGLYELDGTTDAGEEIVWRIRTGMGTLGTGRNKALDAAYLGLTASGKVALKCIVVDASTGEKIVHWYELTETAAHTPRGRRLLVGRGLKSVYWGFELTNVTAGDIELDVIELHPIVLEGRL